MKARAIAEAEGIKTLQWGSREGKTKYAGIIGAGGRGSGLGFNYPKGMFPGTPLSDITLYRSLIRKMHSAARVYGHDAMYPLLFMINDYTAEETIAYLQTISEWQDSNVRERIIFVRQKDLPNLLRAPGMPEDGSVFRKSHDRVSVGGAGHGLALDYVLNPDSGVSCFYWSDENKEFTDVRLSERLNELGVEYVHYLNVDNLLNPIGDVGFIGEHVLSRTEETIEQLEKQEHRAHISLGMVRKRLWNETEKTYDDRLGNVIVVDGRKESVDYNDASKSINASAYGDPSIRLITWRSLSGSTPIRYVLVKKTDTHENRGKVDIYKFEKSSGNKKRYGIEFGYKSENVFAPIKKPDDDPGGETPENAKKLQSDHWKKLIHAAMPEISLPDFIMIELPWEADHISPDVLRKKLNTLGFNTALLEQADILVEKEFSTLKKSHKQKHIALESPGLVSTKTITSSRKDLGPSPKSLLKGL